MTAPYVIPAGKGSKILSARGSAMAFKAIADERAAIFPSWNVPCRHMAAGRCHTVTWPAPRLSSCSTAL
jgi:hypothetical protein